MTSDDEDNDYMPKQLDIDKVPLERIKEVVAALFKHLNIELTEELISWREEKSEYAVRDKKSRT